MKKKSDGKKRFIVKKYIMARSAAEALLIEAKIGADDVWIDEEWKNKNEFGADAIGFDVPQDTDDELFEYAKRTERPKNPKNTRKTLRNKKQ